MNLWYRVKITGWTASFRYPVFIYGYQPTLPVPPYSTIYGIISSACGKIITPKEAEVRYVFKSKSKGVDIETVYEWSSNGISKSNIMKREFLFTPELYIYLKDKSIAECFKKPYYPLLLGRSTELAFVEEIKSINLVEKNKFIIGGTILPFPPLWKLNGIIQALPLYMTAELPRKPFGTRQWFIVKDFQRYEGDGWVDEEMNWGVIMEHKG